MAAMNRQVTLKSRPVGWPTEANFEIRDAAIPEPGPGQILVKNLWLSLDPYMRGRMNDTKSYAAKVEIGDPMTGGTVGEVVKSNDPKLQPGDKVSIMGGWQLYSVVDGAAATKLPNLPVPLSVYLGPVGMPGVTAWMGLGMIGEPKPGETVVVSAASGAVGSVVGQLAKAKGCRAVGIAGGKDKCDYVVNELGFDACVDYKAPDFEQKLKDATPKGIDVYFENVGGAVLEAVLRRVNPFARIPLCGMISQYNETEPRGPRNFVVAVPMRVKMQGFIVSDRLDLWPQALKELGELVAGGKLKYRETVADGIDNAPKAFLGMLKGENFGKQLVKLA